MHHACIYHPGFPTERFVAFGTPHLVTTTDLGDPGTAARTRLGVAFNEFGTLDIIWVASMLVCFTMANYFVTFRTRKQFTKFAFVLRGEIATAVIVGTRHNETAFFDGGHILNTVFDFADFVVTE